MKYQYLKGLLPSFKGTLRIISCDLPFIAWHVWFTTIPFKPLSNQGFCMYSYLYSGKWSAHCTVYTVTSSLLALQGISEERFKWYIWMYIWKEIWKRSRYEPPRSPAGKGSTVPHLLYSYISKLPSYLSHRTPGREGKLPEKQLILVLHATP